MLRVVIYQILPSSMIALNINTRYTNKSIPGIYYFLFMILIISESSDLSTSKVINWLHYLKVPFLRINDSGHITLEMLEIDDKGVDFKINVTSRFYNETIKYSDINGVWYRRGTISFKPLENITWESKSITNIDLLEILNLTENKTVLDFFWYLLSLKPSINGFLDNFTNKLTNLYIAKSVGLDIPPTSISQVTELCKNISFQEDVITKHISNFTPKVANKEVLFSYTEKVNHDAVSWGNYHSLINPSLFQKMLRKKFEVRAFYFEKKIYGMAIFSQGDKKTSTDFRNYNYKEPNRTTPFQFPKDTEDKIHLFMNKANLNSGSLDIVYTVDKRFVFLEVNPVGQFDQVSWPCNYYLEKKIAEKLKDYEDKKQISY